MNPLLPRFFSYIWQEVKLFLRRFVIAFSFFDNLTSDIVRGIFPPKWRIEGQCKRCGECCELIGLSTPTFLATKPWLRKALIWWQEKINGFKFEDAIEEKETNQTWFLYSCNRLSSEGLCTDYPNRPRICREYPQLPQYKKPDIVHKCGFRAVPRKKA